MKKILLGLSLFSVILLVSCNKEENVAKAYTYTVDEEFLNNERGWDVFETDEAYKAVINTSENGLFEIVTKLRTFEDFTESFFDLTSEFMLETTFTFIRSGDSKSFTGVTWDCIDENNYMLFCVNQNGGDAKYVISQVINGKNPEKNILFEGEILLPYPPVYALNVSRSDTTLNFSVNGVHVEAIGTADLLSSTIGLYTRKNDANFHYLRAGK
tara:strand:+ start:69 stop:707 length:639 start_codon:yes stop_codon:yes gene_type:complete